MNFVLAVVIFSLVFMILGRPVAAHGDRARRRGRSRRAGRPQDRRPHCRHRGTSRPVLGRRAASRPGRPGRMLGLTVQGAAGERKVGVTPVQTKTRDLFGDERQTWDLGARPYVPPSIGELVAGFPAQKAGLKSGRRHRVPRGEARPVLGRAGRRDPASAPASRPASRSSGAPRRSRSASYPARSRSAAPTARRSRSGASGSARLRASASSARTRFRRSERGSIARSR